MLDLRAEQVKDFFRAVDVALEVIQVGVAVTVFLAGNLGSGHFFHQRSGTAHDFLWREGQPGHAGLQVLDVAVQAVRELVEAQGAVLREQTVFDAVKTGEIGCGDAFFVVIDP